MTDDPEMPPEKPGGQTEEYEELDATVNDDTSGTPEDDAEDADDA